MYQTNKTCISKPPFAFVLDFFLPTWRVRGGSLISRMNDYNNDDFPEKSARQTAAYRLGYVSVRRLQTKVSEYGGTGKDFMIGKIYLTKLKSCRCLARGQKIREPNRQKMRKYVEGRNPQTISRGKFTRAAALVASAHPKSHPKERNE
jgi:hypothetical protein